MNGNEITQAAQGAKINNVPLSEVKELITTAAARLGMTGRKVPSGDTLEYIAEQVYKRHYYTPTELMLAVDYYNAGYISYKIDSYDAFGLQQIQSLMAAYRDIKEKYIRPAQVEEQRTIDHEKNRQARKEVYQEFLSIYQSGDTPDPMVMMSWMLVYRYLLDEGVVSQERFDQVEGVATQQYKLESRLRGVGTMTSKDNEPVLMGSIKLGKSIDVYQARIVVHEYFTNLMKQ